MAPRKTKWRRAVEWLHLWVGLVSSVPVFIVCITGCLWTFRDEVTAITQPELHVEREERPYLPPSRFRERGLSILYERYGTRFKIDKISYLARDQVAVATFFSPDVNKPAFVAFNPYTGVPQHHRLGYTFTEQFFAFIINGHRYLWMPPAIGKPIVGWACILFLFTLVTGLIWWYPRKWNRSTRRKSFRIKWDASWKRLNIDLHNVLGFYALSLLIVLTITGLVYSFSWFERGYYAAITHGKELPNDAYPTRLAMSETLADHADDRIWDTARLDTDTSETILLLYPIGTDDSYVLLLNPSTTTRHQQYYRFFDPVSLTELPYPHPSGKPFERLDGRGERLFKRNYDIHVGAIGGLPTKILAFFVSLVGTSLPVTGFIIWYNRTWGKRRK